MNKLFEISHSCLFVDMYVIGYYSIEIMLALLAN